MRIITAPAFTAAKIVAAILFEGTMDGKARKACSSFPVGGAKRRPPFLKINKGLEAENDSVGLMKPLPRSILFSLGR